MTVLQHVQMPESQQESMSNFHHLIAQTVFSILDYLTMWKSHRMQITTQAASGAVKCKDLELLSHGNGKLINHTPLCSRISSHLGIHWNQISLTWRC